MTPLPTPLDWPVLRQVITGDFLGRGRAVTSPTTRATQARTLQADRVVRSVCPYCAVGCGQLIYVKDGHITQIEGDPNSPISRGRLCPKGSASEQLVNSPTRVSTVRYRRPYGTEWEDLDTDTAIDMIADRFIDTRRRTWEETDAAGRTDLHRTLGIAHLGGAALDNEENYLMKKLYTAAGVIQVENQARICHSATVPGLTGSFGRGGSTLSLQDIANADLVIIEGSNFAEAHPVGFQWVTEAKKRGARVIHIDPRFSRTSSQADRHIPIRTGTDVVLLGAVINRILTEDLWFKDYVLTFTNATSVVSERFADTEDTGGLFSGYDPATGTYDASTWEYEASDDAGPDAGDPMNRSRIRTDPTLTHPRCVLNLLRRHYARYTPELVQEVCGVPREDLDYLVDAIVAASGRERTTTFCYALGWTQHTGGAQMIRAAGILQLLMGNIGRPGGGIMGLRGHTSIQGSTDIPTLFHILPGYLPMPVAGKAGSLEEYLATFSSTGQKGSWAGARAYVVSLLKAWWGDTATASNDFRLPELPRLTGAHGTYQTVTRMMDGGVEGYFVIGQNPAVAQAHARMQRLALARLKWLVVRDLRETETSSFWKEAPELATGELVTEEIGTEVFLLPASSHAEKAGTFTNTHRLVQWRHKAADAPGEGMSDLQFYYLLGKRIREKLAGSTDPRDRLLLDLTWDYPTDEEGEIVPESVLEEINGYHLTGPRAGQPLDGYADLREDGSTSAGCWLYTGVYAGGVNHAADRPDREDQDGPLAHNWAWAWPGNNRIMYNRASADAQGRPWSERKKLLWWDESAGRWEGSDIPDFPATKAPGFRADPDVHGTAGLDGTDAFTAQPDGKAWLFAPRGLVDGPFPTHYEPQESPLANPLYPQQANPTRENFDRADNLFAPSAGQAGAQVYPYVLTTYRLTEHYTSGQMTRTLPYLAELQPAMFCEVDRELAAERGLDNGGWATLVSPRGVIEARVLVTDRFAPLQVGGRTVHQIGMPFHWGAGGASITKGDSANDLLGIVLDANTHIQDSKASMVDIRPGRRPTGPARLALMRDYQERAGLTPTTGQDPLGRIDDADRQGVPVAAGAPTGPARPGGSPAPAGAGDGANATGRATASDGVGQAD